MPRRPTRTPKHRDRRATPTLGRRLRAGLIPIVATAGILSAGIALEGSSSTSEGAAQAALAAVNGPVATTAPQVSDADLARLAESRRDDTVSRSSTRTAVVQTKRDLLASEARPGPQESRSKSVSLGDPRAIAQAMLGDYGWGQDQYSCLDSLWTKESGWNPQADNPTSSAYGIPQALPGSKMASAGADWASNPATQIEWGLGYIQDTYGSPCAAWGKSQASGWY